MRKKFKKGFTLVELLVVIAILAVLATVSVIGYLSFTNKAKQSNDQSLITQVNTVLRGNEVVDGKPKTMHEVLNIVNEEISLDQFVPSDENNEFIYNQDENQFVIVPKSELENTVDPNLWVMVDDEVTLKQLADNYSIYLTDAYVGTLTELNLVNGFDAGNYQGIKTINFTSSLTDNFTLRTNDSDLYIDAKNASVYHHGTSNSVDITAVAKNSYHEFGLTDNMNLLLGRVVIEDSGNIESILITATSYLDVNIENKSENDVAVIATDEDVYRQLGNIISGSVDLSVDYVTDSDSLVKALRKDNPTIYVGAGDYTLTTQLNISNNKEVNLISLNKEKTTITFTNEDELGVSIYVDSNSSLKIKANDNFEIKTTFSGINKVALISTFNAKLLEIDGGNYTSPFKVLRTYNNIENTIIKNANFTSSSTDVTNDSVLEFYGSNEIYLTNVEATSVDGIITVLNISGEAKAFLDGGNFAKPNAQYDELWSEPTEDYYVYPATVVLEGSIFCSNTPTFVYNGSKGDDEICFDIFDYFDEQIGFVNGEYNLVAAGVAQ